MSHAAIVDLLRQFKSVTQRKNTSFASVVNDFLKLRWERIKSEVSDPEQREQQRLKLLDLTKREYGQFDRDWTEPELT